MFIVIFILYFLSLQNFSAHTESRINVSIKPPVDLICADCLHKFKSALFAFLHILISFCNHLPVLFFHTFRCKYLHLTIETNHPMDTVSFLFNFVVTDDEISVARIKKIIIISYIHKFFDFLEYTPVYNFINDRLVDESAVLRPLS